MNARDAILSAYGMAERVTNAYLADLEDADLLVRPVPGQNHIAWQLGHLLSTERFFVESVKPGSSPPLPEGFVEAHGRDEASTTSDDPARFASKAKYLELIQAQRAVTRDVVQSLSDSDLDAPGPERARSIAPTAGAALMLGASHYLMHAGQFVSVRRKLGKPVAI